MAFGSKSIPATMFIPADLRPALVPPHPQKKSITLKFTAVPSFFELYNSKICQLNPRNKSKKFLGIHHKQSFKLCSVRNCLLNPFIFGLFILGRENNGFLGRFSVVIVPLGPNFAIHPRI